MNVAEYEAMYRVEDSLWWYTGMRRVSEALLGDSLQHGPKILDAGCGTGGNLRWLSRFGKAYGVDLSPQAMHFCAARGLKTASRASILSLPFPDRCFDLVTSFDVIYHLNVSDDVTALREMHRVVKPGGRALVRVPALELLRSGHDAAVHTRQRYSLPELRAKMEQAGFDIVRSSYANSLLFPLAAAGRLVDRLRSGGAHGTHASDVKPAPAAVNAVFRGVMEAEAALLSRLDLPIGLSAVALGRRTG